MFVDVGDLVLDLLDAEKRLSLTKRKITDNPLCPICEREEETVDHSLWSYSAGSDVWVESTSLVHKWLSLEDNNLEL